MRPSSGTFGSRNRRRRRGGDGCFRFEAAGRRPRAETSAVRRRPTLPAMRDPDARLGCAARMRGSDARLGCATRMRGSDARPGCATRMRASDARLGCATRMRGSDARPGCATARHVPARTSVRVDVAGSAGAEIRVRAIISRRWRDPALLHIPGQQAERGSEAAPALPGLGGAARAPPWELRPTRTRAGRTAPARSSRLMPAIGAGPLPARAGRLGRIGPGAAPERAPIRVRVSTAWPEANS